MAADSSITCKLAMFIGRNRVIFRHFAAEKEVFFSISELEDKLLNLFCQLSHKPFTIQWKDNEGDMIHIANDDDLKFAMNIFGSKCYFTIKVVEEHFENLRIGVECTRCERQIYDFKYKCLDCPKYVMCSYCQIQGGHKDHFMIRFPYSFTGKKEINKQIHNDFKDIVKEYRVTLNEYIKANTIHEESESETETETEDEDESEEIRAPPKEKIAISGILLDNKPQKAEEDLITVADGNKRESSLSKGENAISLNSERGPIANITTPELGNQWLEYTNATTNLNADNDIESETLLKEEYPPNISPTPTSSASLLTQWKIDPTSANMHDALVKHINELKRIEKEKLKASCAMPSIAESVANISETTTSSNSSFEVLGTEPSDCNAVAKDVLPILKKEPLAGVVTSTNKFRSVVISPVQKRIIIPQEKNYNVLSDCNAVAKDALPILKNEPLPGVVTSSNKFRSVVISPVQKRIIIPQEKNYNVLSFSNATTPPSFAETVPATIQKDSRIPPVPEEANTDCNEDKSNSSGFFKNFFNI